LRDGEHHEGERRDCVDRPRGKRESQHYGDAFHPARRISSRHHSTDSPSPELRREVWRRLASDLRPPALKAMAQTIPFDELPSVFERFVNAQIRGRIVVDLAA